MKFFTSLLTGRRQYVSYEKECSKEFEVFSGLQQGSKLAPLLFLIAIDDISEGINNAKYALYADDLKLYKTVRNLDDAEKLQDDLHNIFKWAEENEFKFNVEKCFVLTCSKKLNQIEYPYKIDTNLIPRVHEMRDLGVIIDSKLSYNNHIDYIVRGAFKNLGFIKRSCKYFKSEKTLINLFNSLVRSKLEYASIVWDGYTESNKKKIEKVQNRFLRYLSRKCDRIDPRYISSNDLRLRFGMASLDTRRTGASLIYMYKILNGIEANQDFLESLKFNVTRCTRRTNLFYLDNIKLEHSRNAPVRRLCELANHNHELRFFSSSRGSFNNAVKKLYNL